MQCSSECWDEYEANVNCRTKFSSCIWKLSFHLWFNFFPQCMLVVQSCCFPIVGWRGNSSGFYMEIAFSLPLLTSKYFTTFFFLFVAIARHYTGMEIWIIVICIGETTLYDAPVELSTDCKKPTKHSFPIHIIYFSKKKSGSRQQKQNLKWTFKLELSIDFPIHQCQFENVENLCSLLKHTIHHFFSKKLLCSLSYDIT